MGSYDQALSKAISGYGFDELNEILKKPCQDIMPDTGEDAIRRPNVKRLSKEEADEYGSI